MSLQDNKYLRDLAKAKIESLSVTVFGNDIKVLIPIDNKRTVLYNEATLIIGDGEVAPNFEMIGLIYQNLSPQMAAAYDKAKYWAIVFTQDLNYPLTTGQIMRAFRDKEDKLIAEQVDVAFIVRTLEEVGFDLSGWNGAAVSNNDEFIVLSERGLNRNFSEALPKKTSQAFPGYDVLADVTPEGNEHYAQL